MLEKSNVNVVEALKILTGHGLVAALIVPTDTAMNKAIMDATYGVREHLRREGYHDYRLQGQGPEEKITKKAFLVREDGMTETTVSLYRPFAKEGDPRIWFYGLKDYADPFNLLALIIQDGTLYVVNMSRKALVASLTVRASPLAKLVAAAQRDNESEAVGELLAMLRDVAKRGFLPNLRVGDTGVGMTLETALGIKANANKAPDFKGIEIKAKRYKKRQSTRSTLFSQVPNWKISPIGSAWNLLSTYGYVRAGKLRFNHEMNAIKPNSSGFVLELDRATDWLKQNHVAGTATSHVVTWTMETLRERIAGKHKETFWVKALCQGPRHAEEFHYVEVEHTRNPSIQSFEALLESGVISVDYLMSQKGPTSVRDHGYLFKIKPSDRAALFPPPTRYELRV